MSFSNDGHCLPSMDEYPLDMLVNIRYNASMKMEKEKHKVTVLIPVEIVTQLKQEAEKHQRSFNGELVWALQQYLEQQKDKN